MDCWDLGPEVISIKKTTHRKFWANRDTSKLISCLSASDEHVRCFCMIVPPRNQLRNHHAEISLKSWNLRELNYKGQDHDCDQNVFIEVLLRSLKLICLSNHPLAPTHGLVMQKMGGSRVLTFRETFMRIKQVNCQQNLSKIPAEFQCKRLPLGGY